jgi:hypothetical protein
MNILNVINYIKIKINKKFIISKKHKNKILIVADKSYRKKNNKIKRVWYHKINLCKSKTQNKIVYQIGTFLIKTMILVLIKIFSIITIVKLLLIKNNYNKIVKISKKLHNFIKIPNIHKILKEKTI